MALLSKAIKDKEFDVRMIQRGLAKGFILQEEVDRHLKKLPDDVDNADWTRIDELMEPKDSASEKSSGLTQTH